MGGSGGCARPGIDKIVFSLLQLRLFLKKHGCEAGIQEKHTFKTCQQTVFYVRQMSKAATHPGREMHPCRKYKHALAYMSKPPFNSKDQSLI